jgi:hypothetical protein
MSTFTLLILLTLPAIAFSACVNGVNNAINVADSEINQIQTSGGVGLTFSSAGSPTCYNGVADVLPTGHISAGSGTIVVNEDVNVTGVVGTYLFTLKQIGGFIGTLCLNGVSQNSAVPSSS